MKQLIAVHSDILLNKKRWGENEPVNLFVFFYNQLNKREGGVISGVFIYVRMRCMEKR